MKINILTQPLFWNYGGILQNFALQEALRSLGHEPLTVNVPVKDVKSNANWRDYVKTIINFYKKLQRNYSEPFLNPHTYALKERELSYPQREFVNKYINKVDENVPFTTSLIMRYQADMWIVGSDQVWRPWCSPDIKNYFFDFLDDNTCRIAYAASFGSDQWEISPELTSEVRPLAKKFKAVTVRELSGVELCRDNLGIEATCLLDPTLLLTADDYLSLTSAHDYPKGEYIASYVLDSNRRVSNTLAQEAGKYSLPLKRVGRMHRNGFDSIESWLATIAHAKFMVTDSFHGVVFSLIFGVPVKMLGNTLRGNARFESLIKLLDLTPDSDGYYHRNERVDRVIRTKRKEAIEFLNNATSLK